MDGNDGEGVSMYPFGPVLGVTSSVAPWALGLLPTPGLADWACAVAATAANATRRVGLRTAIIDFGDGMRRMRKCEACD